MFRFRCLAKTTNEVSVVLSKHFKLDLLANASSQKNSESGNYTISDCSSLVKWFECSSMFRETWVQSQVASYQRL